MVSKSNLPIKQNNKSVESLVLLFIVMEIIHPMFGTLPISTMIIFGIRMFFLCASGIIILNNSSRIVSVKPINICLIWACYVILKNFILGYGEWTSPIQMFAAIFPSCFVIVASFYGFSRNEDKTINALIGAFYIYILYALFALGNGLTSEDERLGGEVLNANTIGIRASLIFFFVLIKYLHRSISLTKSIVLLIIPAITIAISGSRTAFGIMAILLLIFILRESNSIQSKLAKFAFIIIAFFAIQFVLQNLSIGERILNTSEQAGQLGYIETGTKWDLLGDRGYLYYIAIPHIPSNFWFGIGSNNFKSTIPGAIWVLHSEYLIQLLECGVFATVMYFYVYYWIIRNTIRIRPKSIVLKDIRTLSILAFVVLLFACFITRVSYYGMYSTIIGYLIYNVYYQNKYKNI